MFSPLCIVLGFLKIINVFALYYYHLYSPDVILEETHFLFIHCLLYSLSKLFITKIKINHKSIMITRCGRIWNVTGLMGELARTWTPLILLSL